jgi:hypothetical protein
MSGFRLIVSIVFALVTVSHCHKWPPKTKVLHIGGIFPINGTEGWQGGMVLNLHYYHTILLAIIITLHFLLGLSTFSYDGSR